MQQPQRRRGAEGLVIREGLLYVIWGTLELCGAKRPPQILAVHNHQPVSQGTFVHLEGSLQKLERFGPSLEDTAGQFFLKKTLIF
jgi:hypothetical protein